MRITQWGEFGILCSLYLAREGNARPVGAAEIAEAVQIPLQYTHQILQRLRKGEIIASLRGPQGGYRLAKAPTEITMLQILHASEGHSFEVICDSKPATDRCKVDGMHCGLHAVWNGLRNVVDSYLGQQTLAKVLADTSQNFFENKAEAPVELVRKVLPA